MSEPATWDEWPGDDPAAIALAARIVLLSEASKTCHLDNSTAEQVDLLSLIGIATDLRCVRGQAFDEFLASAKTRLQDAAVGLGLEDAVGRTLEHIGAGPPVDMVGELFDDLVGLVSTIYEEPLGGERLNPRLVRQTIAGGSGRPNAVRGKVRRRSNVVELVFHLQGFDLTSLALIPRILTHELICHIGARDTGRWRDKPVPDVRDYFPDGFMDRAAWILLLRWLHVQSFRNVTPVGHLSVTELEYSCDKREAFKAGIVAFNNCVVRTSAHVPASTGNALDRDADIRGRSENATIRAALELNAYGRDIQSKDWFVHHARDGEVADWFARLAAGASDPSELFEHVGSDVP
jgi:hypothetical protein